MSDTRPNIIVPKNTVVDLYAATAGHTQGALSAGTQIDVEIFGTGVAKLYAGASLAVEPNDDTGFTVLNSKDNVKRNETSDSGAFIWSASGCTVNVGEV